MRIPSNGLAPSPSARRSGSDRVVPHAASCDPAVGAAVTNPVRWPLTTTGPEGTAIRVSAAISVSVRAPTARKWSDANAAAGVSTAAVGTPRACPSVTSDSIVRVENRSGDGGVEFLGCAIPRCDGVELRIGELFGFTKPRPHAAPLARRQQTDPDETVAAAEGRIDLLIAWPATPQLGRRLHSGSGLALGPERRIQGLHHRLEPGEVDVIAAAATQSAIVGDQRRPRRLHSRCARNDAVGREHRRAGGGARPRQHGRHRAEDRVGGLPVRVGAGSAEVGDRHRHEVCEPVGQFPTRSPERVRATRVAAVDEDVGLADQLDEPAAVSGATGIQARAALTGVVQRERHCGPRDRRACDAVRSAARRFDLQDVGAEVAEQSAHRVAVSPADVHYPQRRQESMRVSHGRQRCAAVRGQNTGKLGPRSQPTRPGRP